VYGVPVVEPSGELNVRVRTLLSVSAVVLAGVVGLAPAAFAADADPAHLNALTAHDPTQNGVLYPVKPGETIPVEAGVANLGDKPVSGVVVHLWFIGSEQRLTDNFSNCQYYLDGTTQGTWCEFDQPLAAGAKYSLPALHVAVPERAAETRTLVENVYSKEYADSKGGLAALAALDSRPGTFPLVPGTGAKAALTEGSDLTPAKYPGATSFIYFHLILPSASPSSSTSASPSASVSSGSTSAPATTASTASASGPAGAGGQGGGTGGGGLPLTGSNTAVVAGAGALLLVGGAAAFLLTRRRRDKFTA
jgi:LPXTG-motif cell wall-anchored protein